MSWLAYKLKQRVQIQKPVQTANSVGGVDLTFETLTTIYASIKKVSEYVRNVRFTQTQEKVSHVFLMRKSSLSNLGKEFSKAFSIDYDEEKDIYALKSDWFLFMNYSTINRGIRFRIVGIEVDFDRAEYVNVYAEQIEESGTGANF